MLPFTCIRTKVFARLLPRVSGTLKKLGHDLQIAKSHRFITLRDWLKLVDSEVSVQISPAACCDTVTFSHTSLH